MSIEENKNVIRRYGFELYNKWNDHLIDELVDENVTGEFPGFDPKGGIENYRKWYNDLKAGFPDCHFTIENIIGENDNVAVIWRYQATHTGYYNNFPPTGNKIDLKYVSVYTVKNGKITEMRSQTDTLEFNRLLSKA